MAIRLVLQLRPHRPSLRLLLLALLLTGAVMQVKADDDETCEDLLDDSDSDSHYKCGPTGQVMCQNGWSGDLCNIAKCREGCHPLQGYCQVPGECKCALGWRGGHCDQCTPLSGCNNGFYNTTSLECVCEDGWSGVFCNQPRCKAGCHTTRGYCESPGDCKCRVGWGGDTCEECNPLRGCINGFCNKPLECKCREGWTGLLCQIPLCAANCSTSHGSCTKPGECRCEVGWWGETCHECFAYPGCQNGYCTRPWECVCEQGWGGMLCDKRIKRKRLSFCERNQSACLNGGTCINVPGNRNFTCSCPSLFTGARCDYLADSPFITSITSVTLPTTTTERSTNPANAQGVTADTASPMGNYSLVQQNTSITIPRVLIDVRKLPQEFTDKFNRKIFLQNNARITFRTPKNPLAEKGNLDKVLLKFTDFKLLPLPVFLPRVHEIIPNMQSHNSKLRDHSPFVVFDVGNGQSVELERNQIDENRRFIRQYEDSPDFFLQDLVETERNEKRRPTQQRIVKVNSFNRPFLVSAGATALPRINPLSPSTLRQPAIMKPKSADRIQSSARYNPTTSYIPNKTPTGPVTTSAPTSKTTSTTTNLAHLQEEDIFETQESILQPQIYVEIDRTVYLEDDKNSPEVHHDEFLGGVVHIGAHTTHDFAPHENKAFHEAFIELKRV